MVYFYHRFVPHLASVNLPIRALLGNPMSNATAYNFAYTKETLASTTLLAHPNPDAATSIAVDASDVTITKLG